ncbi:MAG: glycerol-3-phosphate dehydrogenase [Pseudomonadota bacterium]|nr:glycerol-3-phosphate dehydrogenase [Pseudomonadota bacterium]
MNASPNFSHPLPIYDLFIIGGGINGTGIAADAAGRGLSVMLCEQGDLAGATSSASSKLVHGGLRYLEHYEFRLVKEALAERETLLRIAPHLVWPLRFTLPHRPHLRPAWMIRSGLFLYDYLASRVTLPNSKGVKFEHCSPLQPTMHKGFEYSDCWVDDARLVIHNALTAQLHHANIATRTRCIQAARIVDQGVWQITCENQLTGEQYQVLARGVVNAAGPWVNRVFDQSLAQNAPHGIRLIKGSHIVVKRFHQHEGAFILQNTDRRIVFVLPFQDDFCLIGTTDQEYHGDPADVAIDQAEIDYLLKIVNEHFVSQLRQQDIVHDFSGVRPLLDDESDDPSAITRDYTLELDHIADGLPLLSIYGGKITTYRKLAEAALHKLQPFFPQMGKRWTAEHYLVGASAEYPTLVAIQQHLCQRYPNLPESMLIRFSRSYGLLACDLLDDIQQTTELGQHFGADLYAREVDYLMQQEWACHAGDILWRRTKLGLRLNPDQVEQLAHYMQARQMPSSSSSAAKFES